jgi:quinol monooxygenase YgiN
MTAEISWYVELLVHPAQLTDFETLTGEMVMAARAEAGTRAYQRFISSDQCVIVVYERYADSEAAIAHLRQFAAKFGERYATMVQRMRFMVLGTPSEELRALLDAYGARYLSAFGPFAYWAEPRSCMNS